MKISFYVTIWYVQFHKNAQIELLQANFHETSKEENLYNIHIILQILTNKFP